MTDELAMVIDYGIDCSDQFCCFRQFVAACQGRSFAWHGNVEAFYIQQAKCLYCLCSLLFLDIISKISIIQSKLLEAVIVHGRGTGMSYRTSNQAQHLCMSANFHLNPPIQQ